MPPLKLIKTAKQYAHGQEFTARFNFDVGTKQFEVKLPSFISEIVGVAVVRNSLLEKCESELHSIIEKFKKACTTEYKVIRYEIELQGTLMSPDGEKCLQDFNDIHFCDGLAVSVRACVCTKRKIETDGGTSYSCYISEEDEKNLLNRLSTNSHGLGHNWHNDDDTDSGSIKSMDWTQEREDFFVRVIQGLTKVGVMLSGLRKDKKQLMLMADNSWPNLLSNISH